MDLPVEAVVHLNHFQDEIQVREILTFHGFQIKDLSRGRVFVQGNFLALKDVKGKLEQLLESQPKFTPHSSSPVPTASSGAISKYYTSNNRPSHASPSSPATSSSSASGSSHSRPTFQQYALSSSPDQRGSLRHGKESFIIDADVFRYAEQFKKKDITDILNCHGVEMTVHKLGDTFNITLMGRSSITAIGKLQSLMDNLSKSLRTQEVHWEDMSRKGRELLAKIRKNSNIHDSVLVLQMTDRVHLIGSSRESYEIKQKLLGNPINQSGRMGRTSAKGSRGRSSSAPPINRKDTERAAVSNPSPGGATGYSPKDDNQESYEHGAVAFSRQERSQSVSRDSKGAEGGNSYTQEERKNKSGFPISKKKLLQFATSPKAIKETFKKLNKK